MRLINSVLFVASVAASATAERLKLVQLIFRHGQRAPTTYITFPTDPPYLARRFPYEPGEMTNASIAQEFNLGANLRAFYGDFVGDRYAPSQLRVLSGSDNRTIVSAQAVLASFFPPQRAQIWNDDLLWQPIAVHTEPIIDHIAFSVSFGLFNSCPSLSGKLNQTEAYFRLFRLFSPAIKELEVLTGMKIPSLYIFQKVLDAIKTRAGLDDILPLPKWADNTKFLDKIENLQNSVHGKFIDLFNEDAGGWHFDQFVSRMDEAINNRTKHKAILYSGHDTNILTIGRLLNLSVINETMQDFSTYLAIELLEEEGGQHNVKIFLHKKLNGTRVLLDIAECGRPCTFERFATLRRRVTTQEWLARCTGMTLVNVGEECAFYGTIAGSLLILVVLLIGSLLSVLWTCRSYKRRYLQLSDPERMPLLSSDYMGAEPVTAGPRRPDGYRQLPLLKEPSDGLET